MEFAYRTIIAWSDYPLFAHPLPELLHTPRINLLHTQKHAHVSHLPFPLAHFTLDCCFVLLFFLLYSVLRDRGNRSDQETTRGAHPNSLIIIISSVMQQWNGTSVSVYDMQTNYVLYCTLQKSTHEWCTLHTLQVGRWVVLCISRFTYERAPVCLQLEIMHYWLYIFRVIMALFAF